MSRRCAWWRSGPATSPAALPTLVGLARARWGRDTEVFAAPGARPLLWGHEPRPRPHPSGPPPVRPLERARRPPAGRHAGPRHRRRQRHPLRLPARTRSWPGSRPAWTACRRRPTTSSSPTCRSRASAGSLAWSSCPSATVFYPPCRLSFAEVLDAAERVSEGLVALAGRRGLRAVHLEREWYGFDPIHIRPSRWSAAWGQILGVRSRRGTRGRAHLRRGGAAPLRHASRARAAPGVRAGHRPSGARRSPGAGGCGSTDGYHLDRDRPTGGERHPPPRSHGRATPRPSSRSTVPSSPPRPSPSRPRCRRWPSSASGSERRSAGWAFVVAERAGQPVGYAYGTSHRARHAYRFSVETSVYLSPAQQGQGPGQATLRAPARRPGGRGYCNAYAGIVLPNDASVALHRSVGFVRHRRLPAGRLEVRGLARRVVVAPPAPRPAARRNDPDPELRRLVPSPGQQRVLARDPSSRALALRPEWQSAVLRRASEASCPDADSTPGAANRAPEDPAPPSRGERAPTEAMAASRR